MAHAASDRENAGGSGAGADPCVVRLGAALPCVDGLRQERGKAILGPWQIGKITAHRQGGLAFRPVRRLVLPLSSP